VYVVDTNVLVYAADANSPEHGACRELLLKLRRESPPWYLTWGICYEFLRVATHPNVFRRPLSLETAAGFIDSLTASPSLGFLLETDRHRSVAREVFEDVPGICGNLLFDAHTAILMKENGVRRIFTRDADFHRFPFLQVIDPLKME
jgi:toxin-antitoxin system PIN domain toxin